MCLCSLKIILDVEAFGTVDQKDVVGFGTVDQKDVVAAGTVQKSVSCPWKESVSAVSHQSSVISPGRRINDPMLEVGDGRCTGDIHPSPGCAASRPHKQAPVVAVPPGTVSLPEVTKRPPRYKCDVLRGLQRAALGGLRCDAL